MAEDQLDDLLDVCKALANPTRLLCWLRFRDAIAPGDNVPGQQAWALRWRNRRSSLRLGGRTLVLLAGSD